MSSDLDPTDEGLNAFAADFAALRPAPGPIDRDRILFAAGQASARAERRPFARHGWPAVAASLALVAAGEAALLLRGPSTHTVERIVVIREPARTDPLPTIAPRAIPAEDPAPSRPTPARDALVLGSTRRDRLADQILRYGLDGLPASPPLATWAASPSSDPDEPLRARIDPSRFLTESGGPS